MSDFLFVSRPCAPGTLRAQLERYLAPAAGSAERHGAWGSLAVTLPAHEAHALCDDGGRISVLVGNPLVRLPDLPPRLLHVGARRARVHALCADERACIEVVLDGHFALLALDTDTGGGRVLTDRFGFVPVFHAAGGGALVVGTHIDAVAAAAGCDAPDPVSIADFVANLTCTFPYTVYRDVRQLAVAAEHRFAAHAWSDAPRVYWRPAETPPPRSVRAAADQLREALREAVSAATAEEGRAALLLSGGEDSRAVLAAVPAGRRIRPVTWAERENREVRTARRVARAYGAELEVGWRPPDHYVRHFPEVASLVGSQHGFIDVHGYALAAQLGLDTEPCVLGGLSADSLLKLTYWVRPEAAYRSARLPGLREDLLQEADARRNGFLEELRAVRPASAGEWLSLWPFAMRKHGGNVDGNRRLFRSFEAFHANAVLDVATTARPEWKRNRGLYRAAMRPLLARARHVPHTDYRFPYYGRLGNALLLPGLVLARALRGMLHGELRARQRSWPKWHSVAVGMADHERAVLEHSPVPRLIAAADVPALPLTEWPALRRLVFVQLGWLLAPALQASSWNSPDATSRMATRPASMM